MYTEQDYIRDDETHDLAETRRSAREMRDDEWVGAPVRRPERTQATAGLALPSTAPAPSTPLGSLSFECDDCGGRGYDPGSLNEIEPCKVCLGSGTILLDIDEHSKDFGRRKPMGREIVRRDDHEQAS